MAVGKVEIIALDQKQGNFDEVERLFLYVGDCGDATKTGKVYPINAGTDLDVLFGKQVSALKTQLEAAVLNAQSNNFAAWALCVGTGEDWTEYALTVLDMPLDLNVEAVAVCSEAKTKADIEKAKEFAAKCLTKLSKFIQVIIATPGIDEAETWSEYIARSAAIVNEVVAERVCPVPQLHGNNLGVVTGRLCNPAASVADTPMRVATGALYSLGPAPVDADGTPLTMAIYEPLSKARFCVPQYYNSKKGMYWADMMTLSDETSDYKVWEHGRVIDYMARRVLLLSIDKIADRSLNSSEVSCRFHQAMFLAPLRAAAKDMTIGNTIIPKMIYPPDESDCVIEWIDKTHVRVAISVQPLECPKKITIYLTLDLGVFSE